MIRKSWAVSSRRNGSPAVEPYCSAHWPALPGFKMSYNNPRASLTGSDSLSVKPAAREINCGRDSATSMSHEIAGASERRPNLDKASCFIGSSYYITLYEDYSIVNFVTFLRWV